uniref:Uncharacterized protein n=1 Tax=Rhipicephalus microplus TaxID=6941 RepID=A0A6M2DBI2_RHIMP
MLLYWAVKVVLALKIQSRPILQFYFTFCLCYLTATFNSTCAIYNFDVQAQAALLADSNNPFFFYFQAMHLHSS